MTSLGDLAAASRGFSVLERRLFEVVGGWVPTVPEAEVKLLLRAHSFQHAWHARLWDGIAPRTGPQAGAQGPGAELLRVVSGMAETASTVERLGAAYGVVLPRLVAVYRGMRDAAAPVSDGPLVRVLGLILADDEPAMEAGRLLRDRVVGTPQGAYLGGAAAHPAGARGIRSP